MQGLDAKDFATSYSTKMLQLWCIQVFPRGKRLKKPRFARNPTTDFAPLYSRPNASDPILPLMDLLWTPWRYRYVTNAEKAIRPGVPRGLEAWPGDLGCVFCNLIASIDHAIATGMPPDEAEMAGGLVLRGTKCFICLNAYPYTSGHVMVIPHVHEASLAALPTETTHELVDLAQKTERALNALYSPHGMNFGLNLGQAAGAGVAGHLHLHALPRWIGDTNFMTTVAETRVMPEDLDITWERMRTAFAGLAK
jgi:ATP adenylyltransferase